MSEPTGSTTSGTSTTSNVALDKTTTTGDTRIPIQRILDESAAWQHLITDVCKDADIKFDESAKTFTVGGLDGAKSRRLYALLSKLLAAHGYAVPNLRIGGRGGFVTQVS